MTNERTLDLRCSQAMSGNVQHIVDAADDPEISVLIASRTVACEIVASVFAPILFSVTYLVAVNCAQHRRPRSTDNQFAANIRANFSAVGIHHLRIDTEKRQRSAASI